MTFLRFFLCASVLLLTAACTTETPYAQQKSITVSTERSSALTAPLLTPHCERFDASLLQAEQKTAAPMTVADAF